MDYTDPDNQKKAVKFYDYIKKEGQINAIVEYAFNGSRFKVRLDKFNCYVILMLQGIKCLSNDENFPGYLTFSGMAKEFAANNLT